jgi:tRNA (cytidine/uridine-2'-O-)-methyltransferase
MQRFEASMQLALYQPDIPQNTGTILRLGACLGVTVHVIGPTGFDMSDRTLKRAGMDYLDHAEIARHVDWAGFAAWRADAGARLILLTTQAAAPYTGFAFQPNDVLLFGRESAGVPRAVHDAADHRLLIPMAAGLRSLNLATAAAMVIGEALRQTDGFPATREI